MADASSTCWIAIRGAAAGDDIERDRFARRYAPVIRSYLDARWRQKRRAQEIEDAIQDVLFECLRMGGALEKVDPSRPGGFRAFLYGITRNVAHRWEERGYGREKRLETAEQSAVPDDQPELSQAFDRAWARSIVRQAWDLQEERAEARGPDAIRRVDLLRARFEGGKPIREIAKEWNMPADVLHHEYAQARKEFQDALREVVSFHHTEPAANVDSECRKILELVL